MCVCESIHSNRSSKEEMESIEEVKEITKVKEKEHGFICLSCFQKNDKCDKCELQMEKGLPKIMNSLNYKCLIPYCSEISVGFNAYINHVSDCLSSFIFTCPKCRKLIHKKMINLHFLEIHKMKYCDICGGFQKLDEMENHKKECQKSFTECNTCHKQYNFNFRHSCEGPRCYPCPKYHVDINDLFHHNCPGR